jgi:hypothetical protein
MKVKSLSLTYKPWGSLRDVRHGDCGLQSASAIVWTSFIMFWKLMVTTVPVERTCRRKS